MELIDKKGKINKSTFKQIVKEAAGMQLNVKSGSIDVSATPDMLLITLFSQDIQNDKDVEIHVINAQLDKEYVFTGKDFNWFLKADRLKDLSMHVYGYDVFSLDDDGIAEAKKEIEQKRILNIPASKSLDMSTYHVATASTKDVENPIVEDFKGLKHECVKWLNQQIVKHANLQNEVEMLICLDFDDEEPNWKSLKELFDEGKIDIC